MKPDERYITLGYGLLFSSSDEVIGIQFSRV